MRIAAGDVGGHAHPFQQLAHRTATACLVADAMHLQRGFEDGADALARIERRGRILEDRLNLAAQRLEVALGQAPDVLPVDPDAALGWADQAQDHPQQGGLARPGFADDAKGLAPFDAKRDVVHRAETLGRAQQATMLERLAQARHFDQRATHALPSCTVALARRGAWMLGVAASNMRV